MCYARLYVGCNPLRIGYLWNSQYLLYLMQRRFYFRWIEACSKALFEHLDSLGREPMSEDLHDKLEKGNEEGKKMQEATGQ